MLDPGIGAVMFPPALMLTLPPFAVLMPPKTGDTV